MMLFVFEFVQVSKHLLQSFLDWLLPMQCVYIIYYRGFDMVALAIQSHVRCVGQVYMRDPAPPISVWQRKQLVDAPVIQQHLYIWALYLDSRNREQYIIYIAGTRNSLWLESAACHREFLYNTQNN